MHPARLSKGLQLKPGKVTRPLEKLDLKKLLVCIAEGKITNVYPTLRLKELLLKMRECMEDFHLK